MTKSNKIITNLNTKDLNGDFVRYDIGGSAKNIYYFHDNTKNSVKEVLDRIKEGCLNSSLNFTLNYPLTIVKETGVEDIYNGTESKKIDLSKFLTKESNWNEMNLNTSLKQYASFHWSSKSIIQEISYNKGKGWTRTNRTKLSGSKAYYYPLYSCAMSYRPTSICKITLPKGVYLINYSAQVANEYDSKFSNNSFTGNTGILESSRRFFINDGVAKVEPGLVGATLCPDEDFKKIQSHTYKEYPSDKTASTSNYYISDITRTAPRTQGSLISSAYTGHSMIYKVDSEQVILHLLVTHQNIPTDKMKKGEGYFVDNNGTKRILCPISAWVQIMALSSMN